MILSLSTTVIVQLTSVQRTFSLQNSDMKAEKPEALGMVYDAVSVISYCSLINNIDEHVSWK